MCNELTFEKWFNSMRKDAVKVKSEILEFVEENSVNNFLYILAIVYNAGVDNSQMTVCEENLKDCRGYHEARLKGLKEGEENIINRVKMYITKEVK